MSRSPQPRIFRAGVRRMRALARWPALILLLLALTARAAAAPGWMPTIDRETNQITVVLCSSHGADRTVTISIPGDTNQQDDDDAGACLYGALVGSLAIASPHAPDLGPCSPLPQPFLRRLQKMDAPARPVLARGTPPTGPPASA